MNIHKPALYSMAGKSRLLLLALPFVIGSCESATPTGSGSERGALFAAPAGGAGPNDANAQFLTWTDDPVPAGATQNFAFSVAYPAVKPAPRAMPWDTTDFKTHPDQYLRKVLTYCLDQAEDRDFVFTASTRWFHAPWLAREPLRGLTRERASKKGELWPTQPLGIANFAVGYYNDYGGWAIGKVWKDRTNPNTALVRFPVGTVACKLLFTTATPAQVPYVRDSKQWQIAPGKPDGSAGPVRTARLLQLDVAVRDKRTASQTGWVFGTFMYLGAETGPIRPFAFADMIPVGLMWGNDPTLGPIKAGTGASPTQGWINPAVKAKFASIRSATPGLSPNLGLYGRMNGPVDNPESACLACHGRALDGGAGWTAQARSKEPLHFIPPDTVSTTIANDNDVRRYFRNLKPSQTFLPSTPTRTFVPLDYSLQLAVGLENFHAWQDALSSPMTSPSPFGAPGGAAAPVSWMRLVPDAEAPKRGDPEGEGGE